MKALFTKQSPYSLWLMAIAFLISVVSIVVSFVANVTQKNMIGNDLVSTIQFVVFLPFVLFYILQLVLLMGIFGVTVWRAARWDRWAIVVGSAITFIALPIAVASIQESLLTEAPAHYVWSADGSTAMLLGSAVLFIFLGVIAYNDVQHRRKAVL